MYDTHGNVVQLIDEDGKIVQSYSYDSFGNEKDPNIVLKKKWTGGKPGGSREWNEFAQKNGLFEYFSGNMDVDTDGSGDPKNYGYAQDPYRLKNTSGKYSDGKSLDAFRTRYFVVSDKKHVGSANGTQSGIQSAGLVFDTKKQKMASAIVGDAGPGDPNAIGEASPAVFDVLGYRFYCNKQYAGVGEEKGKQFIYIMSIAPKGQRPLFSKEMSEYVVTQFGNQMRNLLSQYGFTSKGDFNL